MPKVLIIAHSFYPNPGVGGVRATQWAKLLPEFGWRPTVICRGDGVDANREQLAKHVHPDVEVHYLRAPAWADFLIRARPFGGVRNVAVKTLGTQAVGQRPRHRGLGWVKDAAVALQARLGRAQHRLFWWSVRKRILQLVRSGEIEAVITTSPPVAIHSVGMWLKKIVPEVSWIADFRDTFRQGEPYRVGLVRRYGSYRRLEHEKAIYRTAERITCVYPPQRRWIRKCSPDAVDRTTILSNGVPNELIALVHQASDTPRDIKVVGFSDAPESVVLARALAGLRDGGMDIALRFVGNIPSVRSEIDKVPGAGAVFAGPVPHTLALEEIASARMLVAVLTQSRSRTPAYSSKLYEYLAVPVPVLVINPTRGDRREFSRLAGVWMISKPTPTELQSVLQAALRAPQEALQARALMVQQKWSRWSQVEQLATILVQLRGRQRSARPACSPPLEEMRPEAERPI